jgi:hypothetical protein
LNHFECIHLEAVKGVLSGLLDTDTITLDPHDRTLGVLNVDYQMARSLTSCPTLPAEIRASFLFDRDTQIDGAFRRAAEEHLQEITQYIETHPDAEA